MSQKIIHWRIAKAAKAIAAAAYEELAKDNAFYALNKSMGWYVRKNWRHYIPFARQSLVGILTTDYSHEVAMGVYTQSGVEQMKTEVYECLLLDGGFKAPAESRVPALVH